MADVSFVLLLEAFQLAANGSTTLSYTVPPQEKLTIFDLFFDSTGAFNITGIRDSTGRQYTNASPSTEIPSAVLKDGATANIGMNPFIKPLEVPGSVTIYIDVEDSSGAQNTITLTMPAVRALPG